MSKSPTDAPRLGGFLRSLRTARGFSLEQLARQAGLSARTLSFWEADAHKPSLIELRAVLDALRVTDEERTRVLLFLGAPKANRYLTAHPSDTNADAVGPLPSGGDLLRALRQRRHLYLETVAGKIGVSTATLSRWESGKVVPNPERLPALFHLLGARPEERDAMTSGLSGDLFLAPSLQALPTVETLRQHFLEFMAEVSNVGTDALRDLRFLTFEAQAWGLAQSDAAGRSLLAEMFASHASYLGAFGRFNEITRYASRAIDLFPQTAKPTNTVIEAVIALAEASAYSDAKTGPNPMKGAALISLWEDKTRAIEAASPAHAAWMLSDKAGYLSQGGYTEAALELGQSACLLAAQADKEVELRLRQRDLARLLMKAGRAENALELLTPFAWESPYWEAKDTLLRVEGLLLLEEKSAAQEWLGRATDDIRAFDLDHLQNSADALASRF